MIFKFELFKLYKLSPIDYYKIKNKIIDKETDI